MTALYQVKKGWQYVWMTEEEIESDPNIVKVPIRDWVQDEEGIARHTIVGYEYVDMREEKAVKEFEKRLRRV